MKLIAKPLTWAAAFLMRRTWRDTEKALLDAYAEYGVSVRPDLPSVLTEALIAAEDHRFFEHGGIDYRGLCRALWRNVFQGRREGASTIEQQLVRQLTGRFEKNLARKCREALLASLVDTVLPKNELPGVYLSVAYFGWRMNGVRAACIRLGIDIRNLTIHEAAALVARLKYPSPRTPSTINEQRIRRRAAHIVSRLTANCEHQSACQIPQEAN